MFVLLIGFLVQNGVHNLRPKPPKFLRRLNIALRGLLHFKVDDIRIIANLHNIKLQRRNDPFVTLRESFESFASTTFGVIVVGLLLVEFLRQIHYLMRL